MVSIKGVNNMHFIRVIKASRTVYHGSPYKFKTFDQSKIGTGDGNKYGWGIYFTSDTSFANSYGRGKEYYNGEPITNIYISLNIPNLLKGKKRSVIKEYQDFKPEVAEFAKNFDPSKYERKKGYVYVCSIPDDIELLDWNLAIDVQNVYSKLQKIANDYKINIDDNPYGSQFYIRLEDKLGSAKEASLVLQKYGIPGLLYEENETDFVIWDTSKIKILEIK